MAASIGLLEVRILIFRLLLLSYFTSDFDQVCGRLYGLILGLAFQSHLLPFKETRSVTMNIVLFKSFVRIELSNVFTINMFSKAESCWKRELSNIDR